MANYRLTSPVSVFNSGTSSQVNLFNSTNTFYVQLQSPTLTSNVDFTLPATAGTSGQALSRTGATSLGWVTPSYANSDFPLAVSFMSGAVPSVPFSVATTTPTYAGRFLTGVKGSTSNIVYFAVNVSNIALSITISIQTPVGGILLPATTFSGFATTAVTIVSASLILPLTLTVCDVYINSSAATSVSLHSLVIY